MLPQWIIERKRDGQILADDELEFLIGGYTRGEIPDYQMAAFAMAVFFRGMTPDETAALTRSMLRSGDTVDTSSIRMPKIDKHSTGGVGDKISLILAPLVACCGVAVPMVCGRGLGITGGTVDKLEAIPGYRTQLSEDEFVQVVARCGCSIIGPTERLAPADRKLYALRDVTGTVPSIPLIVASIMSKKLAEGIDGLVLDVKCGRGAFMRTLPEARALAEALIRVGRNMGKRTAALITAMDQPLGRTAGNALEVQEAIETLRGQGPADVRTLTLALGAEMLRLTGVVTDQNQAAIMLAKKLESGEAFAKFRDMVGLQGGETAAVDDPARLPAARYQRPYPAAADGIVQDVDAEKVGRLCVTLGAGRVRATDTVDPAAGVSALVPVGQRVGRGDPLMMLHANSANRLQEAQALAAETFRIGPAPAAPPPLVIASL